MRATTFSRASLRGMARFGRRSGPVPRLNTPAEAAVIRTMFATALDDPPRYFGPVQEQLQAYDRPLTLVTGDRDPFFSVDHARRQASSARQGELVVLPGVGHFPHLEAPQAFAAGALDLDAAETLPTGHWHIHTADRTAVLPGGHTHPCRPAPTAPHRYDPPAEGATGGAGGLGGSPGTARR